MPKTIISPWQPEKISGSRLFDPLISFTGDLLCEDHWPDLAKMNSVLFGDRPPVVTGGGAQICLDQQGPKPGSFKEQYAPRIYLTGEIQTRERNWHDFFQAISWRMFPATKVTTNTLHYHAAVAARQSERPAGTRTPMENALSQFDECGVIILSDLPELLEHIRRFEWHSLFWEKRSLLQNHLRCIVFGHAIYEKAINPYIGLTAKALLFETDISSQALSGAALVEYADNVCSTFFQPKPRLTNPRQLHPFPILGMPGYDPANINEAYYHNQRYFRSRPTTQTDR